MAVGGESLTQQWMVHLRGEGGGQGQGGSGGARVREGVGGRPRRRPTKRVAMIYDDTQVRAAAAPDLASEGSSEGFMLIGHIPVL